MRKSNARGATGLAAIALTVMLPTVAGCSVSQDDRPHDFTYIVEAVLAPTCGTATCHSTLSKAAGLAFDTVANARATFSYYGLTDPGSPENSKLILVLTASRYDNNQRMPLDGPMPDKDIDLLRAWITDGAALQ